ncbi:hypothetical protein chiPu_0019110 [Chiloscyllium punctatum]|uniref:Ig-like domain-containing protein n=1 Tax=Chiloscyllium punctatum TaxID=137246 RepID=A0A401RQT0_CHIPU|nr:hypothetical protein [Chiloscyllium punctatum]
MQLHELKKCFSPQGEGSDSEMILWLFHSMMPTGLILSIFIVLLPPVFTERNSNTVYFVDGQNDISLKGPDNPGRAGLFTLSQTQPIKSILKKYNVFGIKVTSGTQYRHHRVNSDVALSCTISKHSDTVCLQWKRRDSSQQSNGKTDQIRVNNTVYLMVKHITMEDKKMYVCEVQENGSMVLKVNQDFHVSEYLFIKSYTLYRSDTDHSEFKLVCQYFDNQFETVAWRRRSAAQNQEKIIASATRSQPISIDRTHFGNRLVPTTSRFNGVNFNARIVPVLFEDAGVYTCFLQANKIVTITLITVKVTAEPSDAETEEDSITLTCSVSHVTESIRLVWINNDGKIIEEKTLNKRNRKEKSLRLIIEKADRGRGKWMCVLFQQNMPQVSVPYYLELSEHSAFHHTNVIVFVSLALLLIIVLVLVLSLRKCKGAGSKSQRPTPVQQKENVEDTSQPVSNFNEVQQMQADTKSSVLGTSSFSEYATVNRKAKADNTETEDIHYAAINFQRIAPGSKKGAERTQSNKNPSEVELGTSNEEDSSIIYAQIAYV